MRVDRQNTFPKVREGDTPQGKARVSKLNCKTSRNQIPVWTLVQCCPEGQVAVSGAGAGETELGLLGFNFAAEFEAFERHESV